MNKTFRQDIGVEAAQTNDYLRWVKSFTKESDGVKAIKKLRSIKSYSLPFDNMLVGSLATIISMAPKEDLPEKDYVIGLMIESACHGYLDNMEFLLDKGLDIDLKLKKSNTALHYAVGEDNLESVKFLLNHGANVNVKGQKEATPSLIAASKGCIKVLKVLLDAGAANIHARDATGKSFLHHAVIGVNLTKDIKPRQQVIKLLLEKGLEVNDKDQSGQTPLHFAVFRESFELVEFLLKNGAGVDEVTNVKKARPIFLAVSHKCKEIVKLLLASGANISHQDNNGNNVLHRAVLLSTDNEEMVRILLDSGADTNTRNNEGYSPLHLAIKMESKKIVEILLNSGADIELPLENDTDYNGCTALTLAVRFGGQEEVAKMLIDKGANVNVQDRAWASPLFFAVVEGHQGIAKMLLDGGALVYNTKNGVRMGLIQHAAKKGYKEMVQLLLEHGADVTLNAFDTVLVATEQDFKDCAKVVVKELVRIQSTSLYEIGKDILDQIKKFEYLEKFLEECKREVEKKK